MASIDFAALAGPVSDEEPCGPDLELAGDADYMNFMARAEGILPTSFFSGPEGKPFDRASIDFAAEFAAIEPLLARTRDMRLLTILAKMLILNRDLAGFGLRRPNRRPAGGTVGRRPSARRGRRFRDPHGRDRVARRHAAGDLAAAVPADRQSPPARPAELPQLHDRERRGEAARRREPFEIGRRSIRAGRDRTGGAGRNARHFEALQAALRSIRTSAWIVRAANAPPSSIACRPSSKRSLRCSTSVVVKRDPALAPAEPHEPDGEAGGATSAIPTGAVASTRDVAEALAAIADYFGRFEPSNPALLLVRQAEQLMGKSFLEVIRVLVPNHVEQAAIQIGKDQQMFELPIERLSEFAEAQPAAEPDARRWRSRGGAAAAGGGRRATMRSPPGPDRRLLSARRTLEPRSLPDRTGA